MSVTISLVLPCHNEAELLPEVLENISQWPLSTFAAFELVLVENGSSDRTPALVDAVVGTTQFDRVVTMHLPVGDYGAAVRAGVDASSGDVVAVFDVDMVDWDFLVNAVGMLSADPGLAAVLASKRVAGAEDHRSLYRRAGTLVFSSLVRLLSGSRLADTHGNKVLRGGAARDMSSRVVNDGALYDTELLLRLERQGWSFAQLPVTVVELRPARVGYLVRVPSALKGLVRLRATLRDRSVPTAEI